MSLLTLFLIALGLSMDAFAVAITLGMQAQEKEKSIVSLKAALFFGGFQGLMPVIGWLLGVNFKEYIEKIDHWIAFVLLLLIGGKMILEAIKDNGEDDLSCPRDGCFTTKRFTLLAVATSIDALAIGVSFAFLSVNIVWAGIIIAITTGICSLIAVYIGKIFGSLLKKKAEIFGGVILVLIGIKILLEHLGFLQ